MDSFFLSIFRLKTCWLGAAFGSAADPRHLKSMAQPISSPRPNYPPAKEGRGIRLCQTFLQPRWASRSETPYTHLSPSTLDST
ncbi:hypothetical protein VTK73DRAFT_9248 [Phialemonium thermophilum]|uniref:Secreted protein n=1 Tax=Phialemonium thermophilum TaxID=223376 RepID=A0ABR3XLL2_9PEZI